MRFKSTSRAVGVVALLVIPAGACSMLTDYESAQLLTADAIEARIESGSVFLSMRVDPAESMDALFEGAVVADESGCLRLDSPDAHTVVWPMDYSFDSAGGTIRILDADGGLVGRVGESFHLGGGEVTSLHDEMGFTAADRELAGTHCPGRYWIVAAD